MSTNREIVQEADQLLRKNRVFQDGKVQHLWSQIEWLEVSGDSEADAQFVSTEQTPTVALYSSLSTAKEPAEAVLREFGLLIQAKGGDRAVAIWEQKLDLPTPDDIEACVSVLAGADKTGAYRELLDRFPAEGSAVVRLVFINIANALLANNIPLNDFTGTDIRTWGPTAEYCAFKRYHSLIPLTSAYCPPNVHRCFGIAFARYVIDDLACCTESSVKAGLNRIILNVVSRLHPLPPLPRR